MVKAIIYRLLFGIAAGGIVTFIALTFLMINEINPPIAEVWTNMLGGMIMGIYFAFSSLLYEYEALSLLKATTIHYLTSIVLYFIVALVIGWVPFSLLSILIAIGIFTTLYAIQWCCIYVYFKRMESNMNASLQKTD